MKVFYTIFLIFSVSFIKAQKVESFSFNLYTDSLKKGVYNYINVDGKLTDGTYQPLTSEELLFSSSAGKWNGNSIIIDTFFKSDSVIITACLKDHQQTKKTVTIYIKKILVDSPLKTEEELLNQWQKKRHKRN